MFITRDDPDDRQRDRRPASAASWTPSSGNVKRCTQTPKPARRSRRPRPGRRASPTSAGRGSRRPRRRSSPPRRRAGCPRISPPSWRKASAGTKIPRKSASPPSRGTPRGVDAAAVLGAVDDAEQACHAADRRRQQDDDRRARSARPRGPRGGSVSWFQTIGRSTSCRRGDLPRRRGRGRCSPSRSGGESIEATKMCTSGWSRSMLRDALGRGDQRDQRDARGAGALQRS